MVHPTLLVERETKANRKRSEHLLSSKFRPCEVVGLTGRCTEGLVSKFCQLYCWMNVFLSDKTLYSLQVDTVIFIVVLSQCRS